MSEITQVLRAIGPDGARASEELLPLVYADLHRHAVAQMARESAGHTLQPTALLHEATTARGRPLTSLSAHEVAALIKAVPVHLTGVQPVATAISTAGGISFDALDAHFMLKAVPGVFAAGEMLDWEAPTGGYLLQACFATGVAAAEGALKWLPPAK